MSFSSAFSAEQDRKLAREQLAEQKRRTDAELVQKGYDPNTLSVIPGSNADVEAQQNKQTLQMANALQNKLAAQDTDKAISDYSTSGDANYLQKALDNNPTLKQVWGKRGVQQIANLDFGNDGSLLANNGFAPAEYDTPEKQSILKKNVYKYYDGKDWNVGLIHNVVQQTGALNRMGPDQQTQVVNNHQEFRDFMAGPRSSANTAEGHKYETEINDASEATKVPANLIAAMMNVESGGNPNAVSPKGATGLMQLKPETAAEVGVKNINDPAQNIMGGAQYMAKMLDKYNGDTRLALAAYNAGPGNVDKYGDVPPFQETQNYVNKIVGNYAAGESYYNAGKDVINSMGADAKSQASDANNRIATIQQFYRENAAAGKGTTAANIDQEVANNTADVALKGQALAIEDKKVANEAKKVDGTNKTSDQKNLDAAQEATKSLVGDFGGEDAFFKTDFSNPKNFTKAYKNVVAINKLEGTNFSEEDKKTIKEVHTALAIAPAATSLSSEQAGVFDQWFSNTKAYLSDNPGDAEAKAAFATMRNLMRHALSGAAINPSEAEDINKQLGAMGQKAGPLLAQMKVDLMQTQAKLESVSNMSNPYTAKVLLGADKTKMTSVMSNLQQTLDVLSGKPPQATKSLDDVFGGK